MKKCKKLIWGKFSHHWVNSAILGVYSATSGVNSAVHFVNRGKFSHTNKILSTNVKLSLLRCWEVELKFTVHYSLFGPKSEL